LKDNGLAVEFFQFVKCPLLGFGGLHAVIA